MAPPRTVVTTFSCSLLLIYRPWQDERLSWPSCLTYSGRFTHISGHPSAVGRAQDSERSPVKNQRSTAAPRNQLGKLDWLANICRRNYDDDLLSSFDTMWRNMTDRHTDRIAISQQCWRAIKRKVAEIYFTCTSIQAFLYDMRTSRYHQASQNESSCILHVSYLQMLATLKCSVNSLCLPR